MALAVHGPGLASPVSATGPTIKQVQNPAELPAPFSGFVRKGDYLISDGKYTAFVAGTPRTLWSTLNFTFPESSGQILAFVPAGAKARPMTQFAVPSVRIGGKPLVVSAASVRTEARTLVVRSTCKADGGRSLDITVRYNFRFEAGQIEVTAEIRNSGPKEIQGLSFSLGANALQTYNFSPFNAKSFPSLNFRVYQRPDHALAWLNSNPVETSEKPLPGRLGPGLSHRLSYSLVAAGGVTEVLEKAYSLIRIQPVKAAITIKDFEGAGPVEITVREPASEAVFYRAFLEKSPQTSGSSPASMTANIVLPPGVYSLRATLFPAVVEKTIRVSTPAKAEAAARGGSESANTWTLEAPPNARVRLTITDRKGRAVPGKVSFIGLAPTKSPCFFEDSPVVTGRSYESAKNTVYPAKGGLEATLPAGTYLATSSRGPEFTLETKVVELLGGEKRELAFTIERVVDTRGLVSVDTHMHTQFSDGSVGIPERLRSAAAEGLDVAISADHNYITDYRAELARTGLDGDLAVINGYEVTARTGSLHFNSFPAAARRGETNNGSISVEDETPAKLFALARAKNPGSLVQVNHPRSEGLGYFIHYHLDPDKAASADAPFDLDFDVMEVMNGAKTEESNRKTTEDLFRLLNRGYPVRAVGTSDAHGIDGGETGYSRTYVLYDGPKAQRLNEGAIIEAIRKGRSFVSNGPIVSVSGRGGATFGDTVKAKKGRVDMDVTVTGAPWLDVREVRLIVNGERQPPLPMKDAGKGSELGTIKFRGRATVEFARDGWVAVEVTGGQPLYPLIQQRSGSGKPDDAALPYALTNPILVDADGDGRSAPVWPDKVVIK
jgi:hypothetical protein